MILWHLLCSFNFLSHTHPLCYHNKRMRELRKNFFIPLAELKTIKIFHRKNNMCDIKMTIMIAIYWLFFSLHSLIPFTLAHCLRFILKWFQFFPPFPSQRKKNEKSRKACESVCSGEKWGRKRKMKIKNFLLLHSNVIKFQKRHQHHIV